MSIYHVPERAVLSHRKPASTVSFRDSRRGQGQNKIHPVYFTSPDSAKSLQQYRTVALGLTSADEISSTGDHTQPFPLQNSEVTHTAVRTTHRTVKVTGNTVQKLLW
jgi:hypothetical protein